MKYLISADWLQLYCRESGKLIEHGIYYPSKSYTLSYLIRHSQSEVNPAYKESYEICVHNKPFAYLFRCPRGLDRTLQCSLKIANRILYCGDFVAYAVDIAHSLGLHILGITRLDVCLDCNTFYRGLSVQNFIQGYLSRSAKRPTSLYSRKGSNKFYTIGVQRDGVAQFEYLRFGSRDSGVCTYIYNKSKELANAGNSKPYIRECWQEIGLDVDNVWRVEISITAKGQDLLSIEDGTLFSLDLNMMSCQRRIEALFWCYAKQYCTFLKIDPKKSRKYWQEVDLFGPHEEPKIKKKSISHSLDSGVSERRASKTLLRVVERFSDMSIEDKIAVSKVVQLLDKVYLFKATLRDEDILIASMKANEFLQDMGVEAFEAVTRSPHIYRDFLRNLDRLDNPSVAEVQRVIESILHISPLIEEASR